MGRGVGRMRIRVMMFVMMLLRWRRRMMMLRRRRSRRRLNGWSTVERRLCSFVRIWSGEERRWRRVFDWRRRGEFVHRQVLKPIERS